MLRRGTARAARARAKSLEFTGRVENLEARTLFSASGWGQDFAAWRSQTYSLAETTAQAEGQAGQAALLDDLNFVGYADQGLTLIGGETTRQQYGYDGTGYAVAVLDTGIDYNHPDLVTAHGGGWDFVDDDADPLDLNGHGTHVAGIIAGRGTNFPGVAPGAKIISLRVLGADGSGNFGDVYDALQWVIDHRQQYNIVAVNMSLGAGNYTSSPYQYLDGKLQTLVGQGVFVAAASGNGFYTNGSQPGLSYPAITSNVVSVGAVWDANVGSASWQSGARDFTTAADRVTSFTQRHAELDILAPGAMITSTYLNRAYASMAGTSMASPLVAGAAALIHQALDATGQAARGNQGEILGIMRATGINVGDGDDENDNVTNTGLSFKRLNLLAAVQNVQSSGGGGGGGGGGGTPQHACESIGFYASSGAQFYLKNSFGQGVSDVVFRYGPGGNAWKPLVGDWDGNGTETAGFYYTTTSSWFMRNTNAGGLSDVAFNFGPAGSNWVPLVGDWNGDGSDSIGFYDPATSNFFLKNSLSQGLSDVVFRFGPTNSNWVPLAGDWNGDGVTSVGFYDPGTSTFFLKNTNAPGLSDVVFTFGPAGAGWTPLVGDWNADGAQSVGFYSSATSTFFLRNSLSQGLSDTVFNFGPAGSGWTPLVGAWTGLGTTGATGTTSAASEVTGSAADALFARFSADDALDHQLVDFATPAPLGILSGPVVAPRFTAVETFRTVTAIVLGELRPVHESADRLLDEVSASDFAAALDRLLDGVDHEWREEEDDDDASAQGK